VRWLPVEGFEQYEVSDEGRVRNAATGLVLKPRIDRFGYVRAMLYDATGPKNKLVHRLVCHAFHGSHPVDRPDVNHLNGIKGDNRPENLEWTNDSLNVTHAFRVLGVKRAITRPWLGKFGDDHHASKAVLRINHDGTTTRFPSVLAAGRAGYNFKHVSAVCLGKRRRHGGFEWRFEEKKA